jgi:hypothetical protein
MRFRADGGDALSLAVGEIYGQWAIQGSKLFRNRPKNHRLHPRALQNTVQFTVRAGPTASRVSGRNGWVVPPAVRLKNERAAQFQP